MSSLLARNPQSRQTSASHFQVGIDPRDWGPVPADIALTERSIVSVGLAHLAACTFVPDVGDASAQTVQARCHPPLIACQGARDHDLPMYVAKEAVQATALQWSSINTHSIMYLVVCSCATVNALQNKLIPAVITCSARLSLNRQHVRSSLPTLYHMLHARAAGVAGLQTACN